MLGTELHSLCKGEEKDVPGTRVLAKGVTLRQAHLGALGKTFSPPQRLPVLSYRRSQVIEKFEALDIEKAEHMETNASAGPLPSGDTRQGRSEKRAFPRKRVSIWIGACWGRVSNWSQFPAPSIIHALTWDLLLAFRTH